MTAFFQNLEFSSFKFFEVNFIFLDLVCFRVFLLFNFGVFEGFGKIKKSKRADLRWPPFENIT